jgi:hypothetical protein
MAAGAYPRQARTAATDMLGCGHGSFGHNGCCGVLMSRLPLLGQEVVSIFSVSYRFMSS